jgi:hypothetical protein
MTHTRESPELPGRFMKLRRLERFVYEYDFGDSWIHDLRLEATLPINPRKIYPICVAGKCSAPPEDCGGPSAQSLGTRVIARPGHDYYAEIPTRCREFTRARILERWY